MSVRHRAVVGNVLFHMGRILLLRALFLLAQRWLGESKNEPHYRSLNPKPNVHSLSSIAD